MTLKSNCIYCGKTIQNKSKEHIIHNALGGLYESENICCDICNTTIISKKIDAPFTKIFNPITSRIENFVKTNNTKSKPICYGKAIYENNIYNVTIKNGKVVSCPELCKQKKCSISKLNLKIISYDFQIDNASFKNGLSKIALNFALDKGIPTHILKKGIKLTKSNESITDITFTYPVIPFAALNPLDEYIELDTNVELYHNLILFNQKNYLWCYIDLFNTFQYYVLLSDTYDSTKHILKTYFQFLQKLDRTIPTLNIRKPKHILTYAMYYNVEPCYDLKLFKKRVEESIKKASLKKNMSDIISSKLGMNYFHVDIIKGKDKHEARDFYLKEMSFALQSLLCYFDENDHLKKDMYKQITPLNHNNKISYQSYPLLLMNIATSNQNSIKLYIHKKFHRLNAFLTKIDNLDEIEFFGNTNTIY